MAIALSACFASALLVYSTTFYIFEIGSILSAAVVFVFGVTSLLISSRNFWKQRDKTAVFVFVCTICLWLFFLLGPTREMGVYTRFLFEKNYYKIAVKDLARGVRPECEILKKCYVDDTHYLRVAFGWGGLLDNWVGVVYDASGDILNIKRNENIFGGRLVGCNFLVDDFYFCTFT